MSAKIVLVIEDEPSIRQIIEEILNGEGYSTLLFENGRGALEHLQKATSPVPNLIFLDMAMPIMSGSEFRKLQLQDPKLALIPTVIMSAARDIRKEALDLKATHLLRKPMEIDDLIEVARRFST